MASTLPADSRDLVSVIVWPTHEKSRSDCVELGEMHITRFFTYDPTQPTKKLKISTQPDPTQPTKKLKISTQPDPTQRNPTQPMGRPNPWTTLRLRSFLTDLTRPQSPSLLGSPRRRRLHLTEIKKPQVKFIHRIIALH